MSSADPKGHIPSALDKWLLVRYKKFPSASEIPKTVSSIMMRRVHDKARVHVALGMMGVAALGMFANAIIGKRAAKAGDTIEKRNQQYQLEYNKRKEAELAAELASKQ